MPSIYIYCLFRNKTSTHFHPSTFLHLSGTTRGNSEHFPPNLRSSCQNLEEWFFALPASVFLVVPYPPQADFPLLFLLLLALIYEQKWRDLKDLVYLCFQLERLSLKDKILTFLHPSCHPGSEKIFITFTLAWLLHPSVTDPMKP